ncbi:L,D-transpeptidase family protein [Altererythrobacter sp. MTPC7]|uniref:L,D-transpeptidase family protein n=1 Tax=Altererythrobacter sp. MTPC7 TaxID=3056567 RepID=UPI0036F3035F
MRTLTIRPLLAAVSILALTACGLEGTDSQEQETAQTSSDTPDDYGYQTYSDDNLADSMASNDDAANNTPTRSGESVSGDASNMGADNAIPDREERPTMQLQVVLDRQGFGPGVVDGKMGMSTRHALSGFQEANDLEVTGEHDEATKEALAQYDGIAATRIVTIPDDWGDLEFTDMPESTADKAEMERLGYTSLDEKLAERFHTTVAVLKELNPGGKPAGMESDAGDGAGEATSPDGEDASSGEGSADTSKSFFAAGQQIRVPNVGADRIEPGAIQDRGWQMTLASLGVGTEQPQVDRIVVSKEGQTLKAYQGEKLVAIFTVSSGSSEFPLPLGEWDIVGEAYNPPYSYDPEVLGNDDPDGKTYTLPPGPNGPVGIVWIDLSKEHYGIHGTPEPETIGRAQSSGCVRLTNWDAARLAQMVDTETQVIFEA